MQNIVQHQVDAYIHTTFVSLLLLLSTSASLLFISSDQPFHSFKTPIPAMSKTNMSAMSSQWPVEPVVIQTIRRTKGIMNHSYRDFSQVPPPPGYQAPVNIQDMTFSQKVHHMLSQEEYSECIAWRPHGRCFAILKPKLFEEIVCQRYFNHKRYSSFLRSLNNYGFKHISRGMDRNCKLDIKSSPRPHILTPRLTHTPLLPYFRLLSRVHVARKIPSLPVHATS